MACLIYTFSLSLSSSFELQIWLKDISTPDFSTPSFNPRPFNPRFLNHELFNPGLFNPRLFNHELFNPRFLIPGLFNAKSGVEKSRVGKFMVETSGLKGLGLKSPWLKSSSLM